MADQLTDLDCYTDDWQRTQPDFVIHLPSAPGRRDEYADHIHVFDTPGGELMCIWTQASSESAPDTRIVYSRSGDGGRSWSPCRLMDTQRVKAGVTALTWLAMYASLTEAGERRIFWYADRKQFVLGREIDDALLADMTVPD